jgi:hypothetical protein
MNKILNDFFNTIKNNQTLKDTIEVVRRIYKHFKPSIIVIIVTISALTGKKIYNANLGNNRILKHIRQKEMKYVGGAVLLRNDYYLTTYSDLMETCKKTGPENKIHYYVILKDVFYKVHIDKFDEVSNLALLRISKSEKFYKIRHYTLLPLKGKISYIDDEVFVTKDLNSAAGFLIKNYKVDGVSNFGFTVKSFDNIRKNHGNAVLNDRLELIGITNGNTTKGIWGKSNNRIDFIDINKIKYFLAKNRVAYAENKKNIDLYKMKNYIQ